MRGRGRRNLKRKRTSKETTASASASASGSGSSEGGGHVNDDLMKRNSKEHQLLPATKPTAQEDEEGAQPAGAGKTKEKRKRVVRDMLPEKLIHIMIVHSGCVYEIPDEEEELARRSEEFRASYAERKARYNKWMADNQALIDQYLINGYAESVWEVTDDEDDGDDTEEIVDIVN